MCLTSRLSWAPLFCNSDPTLLFLTGAGAPSASRDEEEISSGDEEEESEAEDEPAEEVGMPGPQCCLPSAPTVPAVNVGCGAAITEWPCHTSEPHLTASSRLFTTEASAVFMLSSCCAE